MEYRDIHVKFFDADDKNLSFLMKETGIKNQSTAIRHSLKTFRENAELTKLLAEMVKVQKTLLDGQEEMKKQINSFLMDEQTYLNEE